MKTMLMMTGAALVFSGGLAANTAFAADTPNGVDAGPVVQNSQAMAAADQAGTPMNMRQQIKAQLTKDGYTDVNVMPSSFYVHAKNKAGDPVAMVIGPDSFTEVTDVSAGKTAAAPSTTKQADSGANGQKTMKQ